MENLILEFSCNFYLYPFTDKISTNVKTLHRTNPIIVFAAWFVYMKHAEKEGNIIRTINSDDSKFN